MVVAVGSYGSPEQRAHSREEWETIRSVLTELYLRPGSRLDDVMEVMASQYGFYATKMMYKKRLHGWGVRKNLKSSDKDEILAQALLEQQGKHVRRRVLRYIKERRRRESGAAQIHNNIVSREVDGFDGEDAMNLELASPNDLQDAHLLLRSLQDCLLAMESGHERCPFSACDRSTEGTQAFYREYHVQEMFFSFYVGEEALALGLISDATSYFRVAGRHLVRCLEKPTHQLLIDLLGIIRMLSLGPYKAHTIVTYRFLDSIVREKLGLHPFSTVIALLVQHAEDVEWQSATWDVLTRASAPHTDSCCACIRLQAQSNHALAMESHQRLDLAIEILEDLLEKELTTFGPAHGATRRTMFRLGRLYYRIHDAGRVINSLRRTNELLQSQPALSPYDTVLLVIYCELASYHEKLDREVAARNSYWRTLRKSIAALGGVDEDSTWYSYELVDFLRGQRQSMTDDFQRISERIMMLEFIEEKYPQSYDLMSRRLENLKLGSCESYMSTMSDTNMTG